MYSISPSALYLLFGFYSVYELGAHPIEFIAIHALNCIAKFSCECPSYYLMLMWFFLRRIINAFIEAI